MICGRQNNADMLGWTHGHEQIVSKRKVLMKDLHFSIHLCFYELLKL